MHDQAGNVLIVGGAGYVGGALTSLLQESQYNVKVYDALLYEDSYRKPVDFVLGDVRDRDTLLREVQWADAVVWLAAIVGDGACGLNPDVSAVINRDSVEWLCDHFDGRIVFLSTCSVYGAQDDLLDESSPTDPLSVYAETKLAAESCLSEKNAVIFRLGTLFGVSDLFARIRLDLVVNAFTAKARRFGKIEVFGGEQYRPLLHVWDAARAVLQGLATDDCGVFNIAKENVRILDLAHRVRDFMPGLLIQRLETTSQDARNYRVGTQKAETLLGFTPQYSVDEGILEVQALVDTGRLRDVENPRYSNKAFLSLHKTHLGPEYQEPTLETPGQRRTAA